MFWKKWFKRSDGRITTYELRRRRKWAAKQVIKNGGIIYDWKITNFAPKSVGKNVRVHTFCFVTTEVDIPDNCTIGPYSAIGDGAHIGKNVFIGPHVHFAHNFPGMNGKRNNEIWVGDNVKIGAGVIILPGVSIGNNAVVGAGTIVTKDVPADSMAIGNPMTIRAL